MYKNMSKKTVALLMSLLLTLSLAVLPARAVSQEEIDALREYRDQVTAEREAKDAEVEALEAQEAGLLERNMIPELENIYAQHKYKNMCLVLNGTTGNDGRYGYGYRYGYRYGYHYGYHNNKYGYYGHDRGGYYHEDE